MPTFCKQNNEIPSDAAHPTVDNLLQEENLAWAWEENVAESTTNLVRVWAIFFRRCNSAQLFKENEKSSSYSLHIYFVLEFAVQSTQVGSTETNYVQCLWGEQFIIIESTSDLGVKNRGVTNLRDSPLKWK